MESGVLSSKKLKLTAISVSPIVRWKPTIRVRELYARYLVHSRTSFWS